MDLTITYSSPTHNPKGGLKMEKRMFTEPQMSKCEQPLDKVTLNFSCYKGGLPNDDQFGSRGGGSNGRKHR
jgi:hypothetical protein